jgi:hypothetical protein
MVLIISYDSTTQLVIEGFGPETIIGAIRDILSGNYEGAPDGALPVKLEIGNSMSFTRPFQLDTSKPLPAMQPARSMT